MGGWCLIEGGGAHLTGFHGRWMVNRDALSLTPQHCEFFCIHLPDLRHVMRQNRLGKGRHSCHPAAPIFPKPNALKALPAPSSIFLPKQGMPPETKISHGYLICRTTWDWSGSANCSRSSSRRKISEVNLIERPSPESLSYIKIGH
jgi:hypothetical protein